VNVVLWNCSLYQLYFSMTKKSNILWSPVVQSYNQSLVITIIGEDSLQNAWNWCVFLTVRRGIRWRPILWTDLSVFVCSFPLLFLFLLVPCAILNWLTVRVWAHVNMLYPILPYLICTVSELTQTSLCSSTTYADNVALPASHAAAVAIDRYLLPAGSTAK